jgi:hypothetical protein
LPSKSCTQVPEGALGLERAREAVLHVFEPGLGQVVGAQDLLVEILQR